MKVSKAGPVIRVQMGNYDTEVNVQFGDKGRYFALPQSLCRSGVGLTAVADVIRMIDKALAEMNQP
jgi:hypothetical protein